MPPFVEREAREIITGDFTFETLVMHGALSSSLMPQIPGVHLRVFAGKFLFSKDKTLRSCAAALNSIFDDYPHRDFVVLEKFIMQRERLVRLLAPAAGVAFLDRYPSDIAQWSPTGPANPMSTFVLLQGLVFVSPISASHIDLDSSLEFVDCFSRERMAVETAVWKMAPNTCGIDLIVKDKLTNGRTFYGLIQAKMTVADDKTLHPFAAVESLATRVKEVQSIDHSAGELLYFLASHVFGFQTLFFCVQRWLQ